MRQALPVQRGQMGQTALPEPQALPGPQALLAQRMGRVRQAHPVQMGQTARLVRTALPVQRARLVR